MMKRRTWLKKFGMALMVVSLTAGCLSGCGSSSADADKETTAEASSDTEAAADGMEMTFADTQSPTTIDCAEAWNDWYTSRYGITETLYVLDENLAAQPLLCEKAENTDENTWVLTLRDDVTFQNGEKMTAQTVKDCWERTAAQNARFQETLYIDTMEADGQTLTVKTTQPLPAFTSALTTPICGIYYVSEGMDPANNPTDMIGTGPYKIVSYDVKKKAVVERYDGYWQGVPALKGATFNIIDDVSALTMAMQNGESDVTLTIPSTSLDLFRDNEDYIVDEKVGSRGHVIWFNYENELLADAAVRKAMAMAIDKESYANVLNNGASVPATAIFPDNTAFGGSTVKGYEYDVEGAKKLLADAGYEDTNGDGTLDKDGKELNFRICTYTTKAELPLFAQAMADAFSEIGIGLTIDAGAYDAVVEKQGNGDFDLMMVSMTMCPTGDPQYFSDLCLKSDGSSNYGHYSNAEVDELISQLDSEFDTEKRNELAIEIQQKVMDEAGYIVIGHAKFTNVLKKNVKNCPTNPSEYYLINYQTTMAE